MEFLEADITGAGVPRRVVEHCADTLGSVDILVNSAGICNLASVEEFDRRAWDPMLAVNLTAPFELAHEATKFMIPQRSGKIINIASLFSFLGGQMSPAYAATKHGIVSFTKAYCDELAQHNIQVNAIAPGYFATRITEATRADPVTNQRVLDHIPALPLGRCRRPHGRHRLPRQPRRRLRQRPCPDRRRRLSRPLTPTRHPLLLIPTRTHTYKEG